MILHYEKERVYAKDENGMLLAEITFPETADGWADIDHTFVDPSLRGQGLADKLVRAALQQIAEAGKDVYKRQILRGLKEPMPLLYYGLFKSQKKRSAKK